MKVVVTGTKETVDPAAVASTLETVFSLRGRPSEIHTGDSPGVDRVVEVYGRMTGIPVKVWPAGWSDKGHMAGYARDSRMLRALDPATDYVVVFRPKGRDEKGSSAEKVGFILKTAKDCGLRTFEFPVEVSTESSPAPAPAPRKARRRRVLRAGLMALGALLEGF